MEIIRNIGSFILDIIEVLVIALAMFIFMYLFLFQPHQVRGLSMYPSFHDKDYLLTDKISYQIRPIKRGEVVVFKAPKNEEYDYIKRIVGLPGEMVKIASGKVYINGNELSESYLSSGTQTFGGQFWREGQTISIPENQYFVLGDNRNHSSDSREWGPVPKENIIGKAWVRYWPKEQFGLIQTTKYNL